MQWIKHMNIVWFLFLLALVFKFIWIDIGVLGAKSEIHKLKQRINELDNKDKITPPEGE